MMLQNYELFLNKKDFYVKNIAKCNFFAFSGTHLFLIFVL